MILSRYLVCLLIVLLGSMCGCRVFSRNSIPVVQAAELPNPLAVPQFARAFVMDQISDELDNYFKIFKEERIRVVDSVMTEGWIETHPKIGGTLLEPWRTDSMPGFERLHATLQTVRRFAKVRVIPTGNNFLVDVKVYKELEDREGPLHATASGKILRHDNALDIDREDSLIVRGNKGWIPMGRDLQLEQQILSNIQKRFAVAHEQGGE